MFWEPKNTNDLKSKVNPPKPSHIFLKMILTLALMIFSSHVFASLGAGTDLLEGTENDLIKTVKGSGKTYMYLAEIIVSVMTYIGTRSPKAFLGMIILSVGFNGLLKVAGIG